MRHQHQSPVGYPTTPVFGLVMGSYVDAGGQTRMFAWCGGGYGRCMIVPPGEQLPVGSWHRFIIKPGRDTDTLIVNAREALPADQIWPTVALKTGRDPNRPPRIVAKVTSVPVVVGAVHSEGAIAWSPFFMRIRFHELTKQFGPRTDQRTLSLIKPGAILALTIVQDRSDHLDDSSWVVRIVEGELDSKEVTKLAVREETGRYDSFDDSTGLHWIVGDARKDYICFSPCDYFQGGDLKKLKFDAGDVFRVWMGARRPIGDQRAFYAARLLTADEADEQQQKQLKEQKKAAEAAKSSSANHHPPSIEDAPPIIGNLARHPGVIGSPLIVSTTSSSPSPSSTTSGALSPIHSSSVYNGSLPSILESPLPSQDAAHLLLQQLTIEKPLPKKMVADKGTETPWAMGASTEALHARHQQQMEAVKGVYDRIMKNSRIFDAICIDDPRIMRDLYDIFQPAQ